MDPVACGRQDAAVLAEPTDFCRLFLLRHPELDPAHSAHAIGGGPAQLSRRGRGQVLRWLEWLKEEPVAAVFTGGQPQCADPARAVGKSKSVEVHVDQQLLDQSMGGWQGRSWDSVMQSDGPALNDFFADFGEARPPGGESLGEAVERMLGWWTATAPGSAGKALAVVVAGGLLSGFAAAMLGMRLSRCVSLSLPHGGLGVLDVFENGVRVACWNPGALLEG
jgi:broad specificity phosphatase PhoE